MPNLHALANDILVARLLNRLFRHADGREAVDRNAIARATGLVACNLGRNVLVDLVPIEEQPSTLGTSRMIAVHHILQILARRIVKVFR